jgi:hypothetical protein
MSSPYQIRHLWQVKTVMFLHRYIMRTVILPRHHGTVQHQAGRIILDMSNWLKDAKVFNQLKLYDNNFTSIVDIYFYSKPHSISACASLFRHPV